MAGCFYFDTISTIFTKKYTMDVKALDKAIQEIALRRNDLKKIDYNNPKYDELEEELHDLEDSLHVKYGDYLEEVLQNVHDKYCPDTDVLFPIAYLAKSYIVNGKSEFSVANNEGVFVEVDSIPGKDTRLVIVPNPVRVILNVGKDQQQVVWTAK
jgi:hypothetical protein